MLFQRIKILNIILFCHNSVFTDAIEAKKRSYEGSNLVNRVNWTNKLNRAGNTKWLPTERGQCGTEGLRKGGTRQSRQARNLSFRSWSAVVATRLKLQYLGVEWRLERRGMEWRLGERATEGIEDKKEADLCRKYLDVERDRNGEDGVGNAWGVQRKQWVLKRKRRAQERDKDKIVRECHGIPSEREGFDGNKLRS